MPICYPAQLDTIGGPVHSSLHGKVGSTGSSLVCQALRTFNPCTNIYTHLPDEEQQGYSGEAGSVEHGLSMA